MLACIPGGIDDKSVSTELNMVRHILGQRLGVRWRVRVWRGKPVHLHFPLRSFTTTRRKNILLTSLDAKKG